MDETSFEEFLGKHRRRIEELHRDSTAARWSVALEEFARAVWQGIRKANSDDAAETLGAIRARDLALALGCARGNEAAWDTFCAEFRPVLYEAARALLHEETAARELADSLLADLYGLKENEQGRKSLLSLFYGRSSLKRWLRAVLYQKFVDEYRRQSRLEPLPEEAAEPVARPSSISAEDDRRYAECLGEAVEAALGEMRAPDRLLLSWYYVQELTLKQIGALAGEHEATISRRLEALRKKLRLRIENHLRRVKNLSAIEIEQCLDFASRGVMVKLEKALKTE